MTSRPNQHKINRQAVIVIHGMGEQRPMDTLRSFVDGVKGRLEKEDDDEKMSTVRSKPDSIGNIYETVRLSMDSTRKRPITDFYEFYWAHNMRNTKFDQLTTWLKQVVFKWVSNVPPRLRKIWYTIWLLILLLLAGAIFFTVDQNGASWLKKISAFAAVGIIPLLLTFIGTSLKSSFLNSLGDVARYFTPEPDNISERSHIRQQGIDFLQKLHDVKNVTKVDRIILVGHSLGSVVSYDLLRLLWTNYNEGPAEPSLIKQPAMAAVDNYAVPGKMNQAQVPAFQDAQYALWQEQRETGNGWLVSDFITIGAALHALDYFMVTNEKLDVLKMQREIPTCPPVQDTKDKAIYYPRYVDVPGKTNRRSFLVLNHGALFGAIRWTNIFFKSDFVGGPMTFLGEGVANVEVRRSSIWCYPGGHTHYWDKDDDHNALKEIVAALRLNHED
jgi:hypothetical protein